MPKRYPEEFRRKVLDLVAAGRPVAQVAQDLGISDQTIYNWRLATSVDRDGVDRRILTAPQTIEMSHRWNLTSGSRLTSSWGGSIRPRSGISGRSAIAC